ncbi:MAG: DEAD/DEAH box helicase family protein [Candidatus Nealsonbacteria bacterium]|nr:DEAD/DEAH box helicase family protein [Candidatus Nealsonbacteria bacterium]
MELKKYQQKTLDELQEYILEMRKYDTEKAAGFAFMIKTDKPYNWLPEIGNSPFVCIKVPTAGGKTLIAVYAVGLILKEFLSEKNDRGLVMWFVPSDAIKTQTINNLRNKNHPYREVLDKRFNNAVKVFDLSEAKSIKKDDLIDNLCIIISTLSAFRRTNKEWLKVYQDNGSLMEHFEGLNSDDFEFLDKDKSGEIKYSLSNVIKLHNPLVIADEGHRVQTPLSYEMLKDINPSFVLEFTATPKGQSNVLVNILARELKNEKMIKMPIYLANKMPWQETIYEGIEKRNNLEKITKKNKEVYIRPIMLIQAEQEKENRNKIYVEKIRQFLISEVKIPTEEIAVQTSKTKELPVLEILSNKSCPIRYIITVNALREGWDCPFAYILVSVSNLGARIAVEQTIGRIMRLPYAKEQNNAALNSAYIFASTRNFSQTSEMVIKGLQENGYEDVVPIKSGVSIIKNEFQKKVSDKNIIVPYTNIKEGSIFRKLDYAGDLIGNESVLETKNVDIDFQIIDDSQIIKIDIGQDDQLMRETVGKLGLIYHYKDFTKDDLLLWFQRKIQRSFISMEEMKNYLEKIIESLLGKYKLNQLSVHRYKIKEVIEKQINQIIDSVTTQKFNKLAEKGLIITKGEGFVFSDKIELLSLCSDNFKKHLYEKAGKMNKEELDLAYRIDGLSNIFWWFRNPENNGFHIQGWLKNKFYPDFIVKTKKSNYFILEYKGEHLMGSEETDYKKAIGKNWERLSNGKYCFELVDKKNIDKIIDKISKL